MEGALLILSLVLGTAFGVGIGKLTARRYDKHTRVIVDKLYGEYYEDT